MPHLLDARRLAAAMTLKCSIAGLPAGGGKTVVIDHPNLDRQQAFRALGEAIENLGGAYLGGGDLGTSRDDVAVLSGMTQYIGCDASLSYYGGLAVVECMRACAEFRGYSSLSGLVVAVQGCGDMGTATALAAAEEGASVVVADLDSNRAQTVADMIGAAILHPSDILFTDADIVAPAATGHIIGDAEARKIRAWAICGPANNQLSSSYAAHVLHDRDILFCPDFMASAGAVIAGVGPLLTGSTASALISDVRRTLRSTLSEARAAGKTPLEVALDLAELRVRARISASPGN